MYNGFIKLQKEMIKMKILIYVVVFFIYSVFKPFADDFLYNMFAATYGPGTDTTALYCGLCAGIFAVSAYSCARWLCKRWDKRQSSKAKHSFNAKSAPETTEPDLESTEPSPTIADPASPAPATPKLRYCKLCGAPIDPATRKCNGCGKQYFRPPVLPKKHLCIGAAALACAAVVILTVNLVSRLSAAETRVEELAAQVAELDSQLTAKADMLKRYTGIASSYRSDLAELQKKYDSLVKESARYKEDLRYCEDYCAYIVPTSISGINSGGLYHRLNCPYAGPINDLVMIEIGFLKSKDYSACPHCYG